VPHPAQDTIKTTVANAVIALKMENLPFVVTHWLWILRIGCS